MLKTPIAYQYPDSNEINLANLIDTLTFSWDLGTAQEIVRMIFKCDYLTLEGEGLYLICGYIGKVISFAHGTFMISINLTPFPEPGMQLKILNFLCRKGTNEILSFSRVVVHDFPNPSFISKSSVLGLFYLVHILEARKSKKAHLPFFSCPFGGVEIVYEKIETSIFHFFFLFLLFLVPLLVYLTVNNPF